MRGPLTLLVILVCHLLVGCATHRAGCSVSVANTTGATLSSVLVRDEAGTTYSFTDLKPHSVGPYTPAVTDMVGIVTLEVTAKEGVSFTNAVHMGKPVPRTFDGRVLFQVEANARVRLFVMPRADKPDGGVLPWAVPPSWEGSPTIPGLSAGE